jgi:hypothetical protein
MRSLDNQGKPRRSVASRALEVGYSVRCRSIVLPATPLPGLCCRRSIAGRFRRQAGDRARLDNCLDTVESDLSRTASTLLALRLR